MAYPVAALVNPKGNEILLYETQANGYIGYSRFTFNSTTPVFTPVASRESPTKGPFTKPSAISAVYFDGTPTVFGSIALEPAPGAEKIYPITQAIPQIYTIADEKTSPKILRAPDNWNLAVLSDGDQSLWIYYFRLVPGDKELAMTCASITGVSPPVFTPNDMVHAESESQIGAAYVPGAPGADPIRHLFYQKPDGNNYPIYTVSFQGEDTKGPNPIASSDVALHRAPLATAVVGNGPDKVIVLYFVTTANKLWRAINKNGKWKTAAGVRKAPKPTPETGLAAVAHPDGDKALLFFVAEDTKVFTYLIDPIDYPEESIKH